MKASSILVIVVILSWIQSCESTAQDTDFHHVFAENYENYRVAAIDRRRFKHHEIQPLIEKYVVDKRFAVRKVGESIEGRDISLISIGEGDVDVFLWSQMHGDESTATMAIFDVLNFLAEDDQISSKREQLLQNVRLHFLPMLNPDGAQKFQRRNALGIDINRDALRLQSPEARILKSVRDSINPAFGFNLHDQSKYTNAERTAKPATISYLAPAYNYEKEINDIRANAMKIIVHMNRIVQQYAPGQVGRYSDEFEPRAFGDNIQKWGTSAILIESGGHYDDPEKQFIRKLNYISILSSIFIIGNDTYQDLPLSEYEAIPKNDRKLFDLKIENLTYNLKGKDYLLDIGINRSEIDNATHTNFYQTGTVVEVGDLSTYYGYETIDATGLRFEQGKVKEGKDAAMLSGSDFRNLLSEGFTGIRVKSGQAIKYNEFPLNLLYSKERSEVRLQKGQEATFLLTQGGEIRYVVVNGFLFDPSSDELKIANGVVK